MTGIVDWAASRARMIVAFHPVQLLRDTPQGVWLAGLPDALDVIVLGQEYVTAGVKVAPSYQDLSQ